MPNGKNTHVPMTWYVDNDNNHIICVTRCHWNYSDMDRVNPFEAKQLVDAGHTISDADLKELHAHIERRKFHDIG
jgi:hypothetical protein